MLVARRKVRKRKETSDPVIKDRRLASQRTTSAFGVEQEEDFCGNTVIEFLT